MRKTGFTIAPEAGSARLRRRHQQGRIRRGRGILAAVQNAARAGWAVAQILLHDRAAHRDAGRPGRHRPRGPRGGADRPTGAVAGVSASRSAPAPSFPSRIRRSSGSRRSPWRSCRRSRRTSGRGCASRGSISSGTTWNPHSWRRSSRAGRGRWVPPSPWATSAAAASTAGPSSCKFETWMRAFADAGVDPFAIANRPVPLEAPLPWDHIDAGVDKAVPGARVPTGPGRQARPRIVTWVRATVAASNARQAGRPGRRDDRVLVSPAPERVEASTGRERPSRRRPSAPSGPRARRRFDSNFRRWGSCGSCPTLN